MELEADISNRERLRARVDELVLDLVRLHTIGHEALQSIEYEATAQDYRQAQVDLVHPNDPPGTYSHYTTG
jgi:hypothetical protein